MNALIDKVMKTYNQLPKLFLKIVLAMLSVIAGQTVFAQDELAPDQNPNYKKSMDKYMAKKDSMSKKQDVTVHETYKAIDDMQIKQERKDQRRDNRQERRLARINNNAYYYGSPNCGYNYNYSYPFNNYPYNYYYPYSYRRPSCAINTLNNVALWGLGAYLILR